MDALVRLIEHGPSPNSISAALNQNPDRFIALLIYLRNPWYGLGERELAYQWIANWAMVTPTDSRLAHVIDTFLPLQWVSEPSGSWRDVKGILAHLPAGNPLIEYICMRSAAAIRPHGDERIRTLVASHLPRENSKRFGWIARRIAPYVGGYKRYRKLCTTLSRKPNPMSLRRLLKSIHAYADVDGMGRRRNSDSEMRNRLRTALKNVLDSCSFANFPRHRSTFRNQEALVARCIQLEALGFPLAEETKLIDRLWTWKTQGPSMAVVLDVSSRSLIDAKSLSHLVTQALSIRPALLVLGGHDPAIFQIGDMSLSSCIIHLVKSPQLYTPFNLEAVKMMLPGDLDVLLLTGDRSNNPRGWGVYYNTPNPWLQDLCMEQPEMLSRRTPPFPLIVEKVLSTTDYISSMSISSPSNASSSPDSASATSIR